jgi:methylmalonyl-CoA mutase N-terminal domain/subunit
MGGTLAAIEQGFVQRAIQDAAYRTQLAVDAGETIVVGVNRYAEGTGAEVGVFRPDPSIEMSQIERVRACRASRDQPACDAALASLERAARSSDNLVPAVIAAVEARATLGEISDAMRRVFGEYQDPSRP